MDDLYRRSFADGVEYVGTVPPDHAPGWRPALNLPPKLLGESWRGPHFLARSSDMARRIALWETLPLVELRFAEPPKVTAPQETATGSVRALFFGKGAHFTVTDIPRGAAFRVC